MTRLHALGTLLAAASLNLLAGCTAEPDDAPAGEAAQPAQVLTVAYESMTITRELPGRIEPVRTAEVRARVAGIVLEKRFEEGADVKAGDLLFSIDPAPLKAALARTEGDLARARATLLDAQARVKRYQPLVEIQAVSQQDFDSAVATRATAAADVRSAQADLETARLNLGYAAVTAPISGRVGRALVTEGALVGQGEATLMARIEQLDPVYVDFTQSAADVLRLHQSAQGASPSEADTRTLDLRIEGTDYQRRGELLFSDARVDPGTGQVSLRGRFVNPDRLLLPGMYVRVRAPQATNDRAILVPQRAVQRSANGQAQVLVVNAEQRIESRAVETGVMQGSRWQIRQGLNPGDQVVVSSGAALTPGAHVTIEQAPALSSAGAVAQ